MNSVVLLLIILFFFFARKINVISPFKISFLYFISAIKAYKQILISYLKIKEIVLHTTRWTDLCFVPCVESGFEISNRKFHVLPPRAGAGLFCVLLFAFYHSEISSGPITLRERGIPPVSTISFYDILFKKNAFIRESHR